MRVPSLDYLRAVLVVLFVFFNLLGTFTGEQSIPFVLRHNQRGILLPNDLVASGFAFVLGAGMLLSFRKRFKEFGKEAVLRYAQRFVLLLLLGFLLDGIFSEGPWTFVLRWGVLQSLGIAGLVAMPFLALKNWWERLAGAVALLIAYQLFISGAGMGGEKLMVHGGLSGSVGYGIVALFGVIAAELFGRGRLLALGLALIAVSYATSQFAAFDKWTVSASYVLISSGAAILAWLLLEAAASSLREVLPLLILGRNSLAFWVLQYIFIWWPAAFVPIWGGFSFAESALFSGIAVAAFYLIVAKLGERGVRISF